MSFFELTVFFNSKFTRNGCFMRGMPFFANGYSAIKILKQVLRLRHSTEKHLCFEDWNFYPQSFLVGFHLLSQHRLSQASKHSFLPPFAAKRVAPKPLGESFLGA